MTAAPVPMALIRPTLPDYDALEWRTRPFPERAHMVCRAWTDQGYGTPLVIYAFYALKIALYIGGWALFCGQSPALGGLDTIAEWWLHPLAFQKAIIWSMLFEVLGLGCGSGPLTGRYLPPFGGFLYFLRPGTPKLPHRALDGWPLIGGHRRTVVHVGLYALLLGLLVRALLAPAIDVHDIWPIIAVMGALDATDKIMFLAARGEHYLVTLVVFVLAGDTAELIAGAMAVQAALWFFAGFSKLNHHFPAVVGVMTSNSPAMPLRSVRRRMYRAWPDDLRPSRLAIGLGHFGTALELAVPIVLLLAPGGPWLLFGLGLMLLLHGFITSNVPMGVPLEWNVMVVYGGFALFWAHPEVSVLDMNGFTAAFVVAASVAVPVLGNLFPRHISFLPSMRYYAGNWAMSVWLFRGESYRKLHAHLTLTAQWPDVQLAPFYDEATRVALVGKVEAFRLMHLHGRAIGALLPTAIDRPLAEYTWLDGELVAGATLGWNFGDGHLHDEQLLGLIQRACRFEPGELRCIFVESQPLGRDSHAYRVVDAHDGVIEAGELPVAALRQRQPWALGALEGAE